MKPDPIRPTDDAARALVRALLEGRGEQGEFHSLTVPMAICNTLILELSRTDDGRSLETLAKVETLQRLFRGKPG